MVFDKSLFPPEFWEARERERARLRKLKPTLEAKYGALTDEQLAPIDRAERELAACDDCDGQTCRKNDCRFLQPIIRLEGGEPKISRVECRVYAVNQFRKVCRHSSLPSKYADKTFDDYEVTDDNRRAVKLAKAFCSAKPREGLFLFGECGTGKTFLAALVVKEYLRDFKSVVFGDVPALLDEIKRTFDAPKKSTDALAHVTFPLRVNLERARSAAKSSRQFSGVKWSAPASAADCTATSWSAKGTGCAEPPCLPNADPPRARSAAKNSSRVISIKNIARTHAADVPKLWRPPVGMQRSTRRV